ARHQLAGPGSELRRLGHAGSFCSIIKGDHDAVFTGDGAWGVAGVVQVERVLSLVIRDTDGVREVLTASRLEADLRIRQWTIVHQDATRNRSDLIILATAHRQKGERQE